MIISTQNLINNAGNIVTGVAVICTLISIVTEFTKEIGFLRNIPTNLQVLVMSLIICTLSYLAFISDAKNEFVWYHLVAVIFSAFVIALITTKGWDYTINIWKRFYKNS